MDRKRTSGRALLSLGPLREDHDPSRVRPDPGADLAAGRQFARESTRAARPTGDRVRPCHAVEYLERWRASNEVFGDDVRLATVIEWPDGAVSFGITQPQYHGEPAEPRDIERCFLAAGWTRLKDPSGHLIFFNHAFGIMAIDAERRNCYLTAGELQPFDVILCRPDEEMERFLGIYP